MRGNSHDVAANGRNRGVGGTGAWDGQQLFVSGNWQRHYIYANGSARAIFDLSYETSWKPAGKIETADEWNTHLTSKAARLAAPIRVEINATASPPAR